MAKYPNRTIMYDYLNNRSNAKRRKIDFNLTFEEWWNLWQPFYHLRGRGSGKYQLCRKGDTGSYDVNNCYIDSHENNRAVQIPGVKKIFEDDIKAICELKGKKRTKDIAVLYNVTPHCIQEIWRKHIQE